MYFRWDDSSSQCLTHSSPLPLLHSQCRPVWWWLPCQSCNVVLQVECGAGNSSDQVPTAAPSPTHLHCFPSAQPLPFPVFTHQPAPRSPTLSPDAPGSTVTLPDHHWSGPTSVSQPLCLHFDPIPFQAASTISARYVADRGIRVACPRYVADRGIRVACPRYD